MKSPSTFLKRAALGGAGVVVLLLHLWAVLALYFWFSGQGVLAVPLAAGYVLLLVVIFRLAKGWRHGILVSVPLAAVVAAWWAGRVPQTGLNYPLETEQAARMEVDGNFLTMHAIRDFRYRSVTDFDARWSTRTYDLEKLEAVDLFFNNWGVPGVDHVITSFVFADQPPLAVSIELRAEEGEPNTLARGFFKQYELFYVWADERDVVKLRTNYRKEQVSLFRTNLPPETGRRLLLEMARRSNALQEQPEFYNTLTDNCANVIARHVDHLDGHELPWFRRPVLTAKYVRMGYDAGWLVGNEPWEAFRAAALINERAMATGDSPDFSKRIRSHFPPPVVEQYPSQ